jgi:hypothetical protein
MPEAGSCEDTMAVNRNNSLNRGFIGVDKRVGNDGIFRPRAEYLDAMNQGRFVEYDFTTGSYYSPVRIDRLSSGMYEDKTGVLASNFNDLRIMYGATNGATLGLLVEKQSTNYIVDDFGDGNSETFHGYGQPFIFFNPEWTRGFTTTQSATGGWSITNFQAAPAPDGLPTAELMVPGIAGSKTCYSSPFLSLSGYTLHCISIFCKVHGVTQEGVADNGATAPTRFQFGDGFNGAYHVQFNIMNGTIISQTGVSAAWIENYGNGWYRCSFSRIYTSGGVGFNIAPYPSDHTPNVYSPNYKGYTSSTPGQTGMLLWGYQSEINTYYPTSYIRTGQYDPAGEIYSPPGYVIHQGGVVSTRKADQVYITGVTSWLQFPGTFFVEYYRRDGLPSGTGVTQHTVIATENITGRFICVDHTPSGTTVALRWSGGSTTAPGGVTGLNRVAFSVRGASGASSSVQIVLNGGTASGVATSDFNIDAAQWITIGSRSTGLTSGYSNFYDGIIRRIRFYPRELTAQEMRDITRV